MENQKILTGSGASGKKKVRKAVQNTLAMLAASHRFNIDGISAYLHRVEQSEIV